MSERPTSPPDHEALRTQWLRHAGAAFDLMSHAEHQGDLVTFDQRETRVVELLRDLGAWLLARQANADAAARPAADAAVACPKCGQAATRVTGPDEPLPPRRLTTLTGEVELRRQRWTCTTCRVVFFPPRRQAGPGHRGLQPRRAPQGHAPGGQGPLLQGGQ